ncbi:MAG: hypothetical protein WCB27_17340 [Thermoguttaceae bacterium]
MAICEAANRTSGVLESNAPLIFTWSAKGANPVSLQTVKIDNKLVASTGGKQIGGPYSGQYYCSQIGTWTAGSHTYTITATDSKGLSYTYTRSFATVGPVVPAVTSVVVTEAAAPRDGILQSNENLEITWAASSSSGIARQNISVDGKPLTSLYGPYSGRYYASLMGTRSAGAHSYVITATDKNGLSFSESGTFTVVASQATTPTISAVVVAEAATAKNGILESSDKLKITWVATSNNHIASQTVTVDGHSITPVAGPFSGRYYSCQIGAWSAGTHTYAIAATDASGISSTSSGTFTVVASNTTPLTIESAVVAEAAAPKNRILESTDALVITWAASSSAKITSQTMTIDGRTVSPIYGPYGGLYYSCQIGAWSSGAHNYVITATNAQGFSLNTSGTFTIAAALTVDARVAPHSNSLDLMYPSLPLGTRRSLIG